MSVPKLTVTTNEAKQKVYTLTKTEGDQTATFEIVDFNGGKLDKFAQVKVKNASLFTTEELKSNIFDRFEIEAGTSSSAALADVDIEISEGNTTLKFTEDKAYNLGSVADAIQPQRTSVPSNNNYQAMMQQANRALQNPGNVIGTDVTYGSMVSGSQYNALELNKELQNYQAGFMNRLPLSGGYNEFNVYNKATMDQFVNRENQVVWDIIHQHQSSPVNAPTNNSGNINSNTNIAGVGNNPAITGNTTSNNDDLKAILDKLKELADSNQALKDELAKLKADKGTENTKQPETVTTQPENKTNTEEDCYEDPVEEKMCNYPPTDAVNNDDNCSEVTEEDAKNFMKENERLKEELEKANKRLGESCTNEDYSKLQEMIDKLNQKIKELEKAKENSTEEDCYEEPLGEKMCDYPPTEKTVAENNTGEGSTGAGSTGAGSTGAGSTGAGSTGAGSTGAAKKKPTKTTETAEQKAARLKNEREATIKSLLDKLGKGKLQDGAAKVLETIHQNSAGKSLLDHEKLVQLEDLYDSATNRTLSPKEYKIIEELYTKAQTGKLTQAEYELYDKIYDEAVDHRKNFVLGGIPFKPLHKAGAQGSNYQHNPFDWSTTPNAPKTSKEIEELKTNIEKLKAAGIAEPQKKKYFDSTISALEKQLARLQGTATKTGVQNPITTPVKAEDAKKAELKQKQERARILKLAYETTNAPSIKARLKAQLDEANADVVAALQK